MTATDNIPSTDGQLQDPTSTACLPPPSRNYQRRRAVPSNTPDSCVDPESNGYQRLLHAFTLNAYAELFRPIYFRIERVRKDGKTTAHLLILPSPDFISAVEMFRELGWRWMTEGDKSPLNRAIRQRDAAIRRLRAEYRKIGIDKFVVKHEMGAGGGQLSLRPLKYESGARRMGFLKNSAR